MGLHKLTAGDGYMYLIRQVAASDATNRGRPSLSDYYSTKGESPESGWARGWPPSASPSRGTPLTRSSPTYGVSPTDRRSAKTK